MDNLQCSSLWLNLHRFGFTESEKKSAIDVYSGKIGIKLTEFLNRIKINEVKCSSAITEIHTALLIS